MGRVCRDLSLFLKFTGKMYYEAGQLHSCFHLSSAPTWNFFPMHPLGLMGMPRRVSSYDPGIRLLNVLASLVPFSGLDAFPFLLNSGQLTACAQAGRPTLRRDRPGSGCCPATSGPRTSGRNVPT